MSSINFSHTSTIETTAYDICFVFEQDAFKFFKDREGTWTSSNGFVIEIPSLVSSNGNTTPETNTGSQSTLTAKSMIVHANAETYVWFLNLSPKVYSRVIIAITELGSVLKESGYGDTVWQNTAGQELKLTPIRYRVQCREVSLLTSVELRISKRVWEWLSVREQKNGNGFFFIGGENFSCLSFRARDRWSIGEAETPLGVRRFLSFGACENDISTLRLTNKNLDSSVMSDILRDFKIMSTAYKKEMSQTEIEEEDGCVDL
jgi:hypothetical protein